MKIELRRNTSEIINVFEVSNDLTIDINISLLTYNRYRTILLAR